MARTSCSGPHNRDVKDIHNHQFEDFTLTEYEPHPAIKPPVAA
jgi:thymidylate synthase